MNLAEFSYYFNQTAAFARQGTGFVYLVAAVLGVWFVGSGLIWVVQKGNSRYASQGGDKTWGQILMRFFWATCVITLARMMDFVQATNGSVDGAREALAYFQASGSSPAFNAIYAALSLWCVFIGTIGFCRGFILFDKASQGSHDSGDNFWRGLWHVVGGALTVQIFS